MKKFNEYKPQVAQTSAIIGFPSVAKNKIAYVSLALIIVIGVLGFSFIQRYKVDQVKAEIANTNGLIDVLNGIIEKDKAYIKTTLNDYFYNDRSAPKYLEEVETVGTIEKMDYDSIVEYQVKLVAEYEQAQKALATNFFYLNRDTIKAKDWSESIRLDGGAKSPFDDNPEYQEYMKYSEVQKPNQSQRGMLTSYQKIKHPEVMKARANIARMGEIINLLDRAIDQSKLKKREPAPPAPPKAEVVEKAQVVESKEVISKSDTTTQSKPTEKASAVEEKKAVATKPKPAPQPKKSSVPTW